MTNLTFAHEDKWTFSSSSFLASCKTRQLHVGGHFQSAKKGSFFFFQATSKGIGLGNTAPMFLYWMTQSPKRFLEALRQSLKTLTNKTLHFGRGRKKNSTWQKSRVARVTRSAHFRSECSVWPSPGFPFWSSGSSDGCSAPANRSVKVEADASKSKSPREADVLQVQWISTFASCHQRESFCLCLFCLGRKKNAYFAWGGRKKDKKEKKMFFSANKSFFFNRTKRISSA